MKNYLFLGDTHGNLAFTELAMRMAFENGADIIQVGDWGFLWTNHDQLQSLSDALSHWPVDMHFIDGNHENFTMLREAYNKAEGDYPGGGIILADHVIYHPRGSSLEDEDGTRFLFCGGAPSIDWQFRKNGRSWWRDEEIISEEEYQLALNREGPFHVIVTHDAPDYPPGYGPKGDGWFRERGNNSMRMIAGLVSKHRPQMLVHGHWHTRATTWYGETRVEALDCDNADLEKATLLWSRDE